MLFQAFVLLLPVFLIYGNDAWKTYNKQSAVGVSAPVVPVVAFDQAVVTEPQGTTETLLPKVMAAAVGGGDLEGEDVPQVVQVEDLEADGVPEVVKV